MACTVEFYRYILLYCIYDVPGVNVTELCRSASTLLHCIIVSCIIFTKHHIHIYTTIFALFALDEVRVTRIAPKVAAAAGADSDVEGPDACSCSTLVSDLEACVFTHQTKHRDSVTPNKKKPMAIHPVGCTTL